LSADRRTSHFEPIPLRDVGRRDGRPIENRWGKGLNGGSWKNLGVTWSDVVLDSADVARSAARKSAVFEASAADLAE
jgi:hypothetical protein